jgi:isopentenyl diphosphate isomerase/L-lactate dehydrogenase-like FMN-dependent dehydrogenase
MVARATMESEHHLQGDSDTAAVFHVDGAEGYLNVLDGQAARLLDTRPPVQAGQWTRFTMRLNYVTHEGFKLPQLDEHVDMSGGALSIGRYFTEMLDPSMDWDDVAKMVADWDGQFCLKGVMSVEDAKRAAEIGCTGIVLSNHGGRQLDGSRSAFDQLAEVVDAVGDRLDVMMDGGVQRGTHVLKALSLGAKAVGLGRYYLFPLAAAGQPGVERALGLMRTEIERDMRLMGASSIADLGPSNLRFRG